MWPLSHSLGNQDMFERNSYITCRAMAIIARRFPLTGYGVAKRCCEESVTLGTAVWLQLWAAALKLVARRWGGTTESWLRTTRILVLRPMVLAETENIGGPTGNEEAHDMAWDTPTCCRNSCNLGWHDWACVNLCGHGDGWKCEHHWKQSDFCGLS